MASCGAVRDQHRCGSTPHVLIAVSQWDVPFVWARLVRPGDWAWFPCGLKPAFCASEAAALSSDIIGEVLVLAASREGLSFGAVLLLVAVAKLGTAALLAAFRLPGLDFGFGLD